jgi:hypothetical protein
LAGRRAIVAGDVQPIVAGDVQPCATPPDVAKTSAC